jgi:cytochrome c oxidase assembly protein subunit 19
MASNAAMPARGLAPKPPDKGSFPLDHFRECSEAKEQYLACLKDNTMRADGDACRTFSAAYLQCRMDACAAHGPKRCDVAGHRCACRYARFARRSLMRKEDLSSLGYHEAARSGENGSQARGDEHSSQARQQARSGFVAGVPTKKPPPRNDSVIDEPTTPKATKKPPPRNDSVI